MTENNTKKIARRRTARYPAFAYSIHLKTGNEGLVAALLADPQGHEKVAVCQADGAGNDERENKEIELITECQKAWEVVSYVIGVVSISKRDSKKV